MFEPEGKPAHIFLVHDHEMVLNQHSDLEFRILPFGDQILPCEIWVRNVDRDNLLSRRVLISYQVEECTVVPNASCRKNNGVRIRNRSSPTGENDQHIIAGVKFIDELNPFQIRTDFVLLEICYPHEVFL